MKIDRGNRYTLLETISELFIIIGGMIIIGGIATDKVALYYTGGALLVICTFLAFYFLKKIPICPECQKELEGTE